MGYTLQSPGEYAACILAAALAEGFKGPVFIQGDHMQMRRSNYTTDPEKEIDFIQALIKESVEAGFYNIDIDASTLVDIEKTDLLDQQEVNGRITAEMTKFIRNIEPNGITVSVGGEIGEIGAGNSTVARPAGFYEKISGKPGSRMLRGFLKLAFRPALPTAVSPCRTARSPK